MQKLFAAAFCATFALVPTACNKSPEGGSPGTDDSFRLAGGTIPNAIKQGDSESIKFSVERGKNFHKSVRLEAKAPDKIHVSLDRDFVKDGESPVVNVKVHPAEEAPAGDYKVTIAGTTDNGSPTNLELTVKVIKK